MQGTPRDFFKGHMLADPWFDRDGVRLCLDIADPASPRAISTIRVYRRCRMVGDGVGLRAGAIGDVATLEPYRRRGIAARLMDDAVAYMKRVGYAIAVLHTSKRNLASYYSKQGFTAGV